MSPLIVARLGLTAGCAAFVAGIWLALGLAAALMTAGVLTTAAFLVLADTGDAGTAESRGPGGKAPR